MIAPTKNSPQKIACGVYTRVSTQGQMQREFTSIEAQANYCEAYIESQQGNGWFVAPEVYSDPGLSGSTMARPGLQKLLEDVRAGRIQMVIAYRFDRISRSSRDFHNICDELEGLGVGIVSVTEQISTSEPAGKAMRSMLATFNQLEVDTIKQRTRDKIAEAKRQGRWCGGLIPLGYRAHPDGGKLEVDQDEAPAVQTVFREYLRLKSLSGVAVELNRRGWLTKRHETKTGKIWGGKQWTKTTVHNHIRNHLYVGEVRHNGETYAGQHEAIIDRETWDQAQDLLKANRRGNGVAVRNTHRHILRGIVHCKSCDAVMRTTVTKKNGRAYKYLICSKATADGWHTCPHPSIPAPRVEAFVVEMIKSIGSDPELQEATLEEINRELKEGLPQLKQERQRLQGQLRSAKAELKGLVASLGSGEATDAVRGRIAELEQLVRTTKHRLVEIGDQVRAADSGLADRETLISALEVFTPIWDLLFPFEQERIIQLLIRRIDFDGEAGKLAITFKPAGIVTLAGEIETDEEAHCES